VTHREHKMKDGKLDKHKSRWCVGGDQQDYYLDDCYALVLNLKVTEVLSPPMLRLVAAIAAQHGRKSTVHIQTKRSSESCHVSEDAGEDVYAMICIPTEWWFARIQEGHVPLAGRF
jgi:hypothetical protein